MTFKVGDKVRCIKDIQIIKPHFEYFPGEAIFRGQNENHLSSWALERLDGNDYGGAQNRWWSFPKKDEVYLELCETPMQSYFATVKPTLL